MVDYGYHEFIKVEKEDKVLVVTLNNPEARNAQFTTENRYFKHIWTTLREDDEIGAVVLTGAGKAFCAGGNVKKFAARTGGVSTATAEEEELFESRRREYGRTFGVPLTDPILDVPQPVICACNGDAVGAGLAKALECDVVIAAEEARFGDVHPKVGLVPSAGCTILPLLVGLNKAKELLMTGDLITAREAERIGMVNKVVKQEELMPTAMELAKRLADGAPLAVRAAKSVCNQFLRQAQLMTSVGVVLEMITLLSDDHKEAALSFVEKRAARFTGAYPTRPR